MALASGGGRRSSRRRGRCARRRPPPSKGASTDRLSGAGASTGVLSSTLEVARCGGSAGCVLCVLWAVPAAVLGGGVPCGGKHITITLTILLTSMGLGVNPGSLRRAAPCRPSPSVRSGRAPENEPYTYIHMHVHIYTYVCVYVYIMYIHRVNLTILLTSMLLSWIHRRLKSGTAPWTP